MQSKHEELWPSPDVALPLSQKGQASEWGGGPQAELRLQRQGSPLYLVPGLGPSKGRCLRGEEKGEGLACSEVTEAPPCRVSARLSTLQPQAERLQQRSSLLLPPERLLPRDAVTLGPHRILLGCLQGSGWELQAGGQLAQTKGFSVPVACQDVILHKKLNSLPLRTSASGALLEGSVVCVHWLEGWAGTQRRDVRVLC